MTQWLAERSESGHAIDTLGNGLGPRPTDDGPDAPPAVAVVR
ncbi:hypothetical protein ACFWHW_13530 [Streptomyces pharetrae]